MTPGLYVESVPCDIDGSPALAACERLKQVFQDDADLAAGVGLAVTPVSPRHIWVSMVRAMTPGHGMGMRAMDALCIACDATGVTIELRAIAVAGCGGLDQRSLESFYARCGFTVDPDRCRIGAMVRMPRRSSMSRAA